MSLYNMLFGTNDATPLLLAAIGVKLDEIPRFRNCYFEGDNIAIYTRTGGGNREYYDEENEDNPEGPWNSNLTANPHYVRDEDDDFDSTYATFYFKFPDELAEDLKALAAASESHKPSDQWKALFASLSKPA